MKSSEIASQLKQLLQELPDDRADAARLDELRRIFTKLDTEGAFDPRTTGPASQKWRSHLVKCRKEMVQQLCDRIEEGKRTAVRTFFGLITGCPVQSNSGQRLLSADMLGTWIFAVIHNELDKGLTNMILEFIVPYRDAQYYLLVAIAKEAAKKVEEANQAERLLHILTMIPIATKQRELDDKSGYLIPPTHEATSEEAGSSDSESDDEDDDTSHDDSESDEELAKTEQKTTNENKTTNLFPFQRIQAHKRAWLRAWLQVLKLPLPKSSLKQALQFVPQSVLPIVSQPLLFSDYFTAAYHNRGVIPILALDGLFMLMTQHGLEYKDFYKQLYSCVTTQNMYMKYRENFFRLLDKCLSRNEMLPAHIVAAFCKRLMRCSLGAPPSSILFCIALVSNLLRKHPEISCLVHRDVDKMQDGFDADTDNPEQANALQSSLWELGALSRHYYPAVVTLAKSVGREEELKTPLHNMDDFFISYKSMFEQERKRKRKKETPLAYVKPVGLFHEKDVLAGFVQLPNKVE